MILEEFIGKYQINLTKQQLEGVTSIEMPTLLLAVPGSGKTTVLVYRLGYMIYCKNITPEKILTLTSVSYTHLLQIFLFRHHSSHQCLM